MEPAAAQLVKLLSCPSWMSLRLSIETNMKELYHGSIEAIDIITVFVCQKSVEWIYIHVCILPDKNENTSRPVGRK